LPAFLNENGMLQNFLKDHVWNKSNPNSILLIHFEIGTQF